MSIVQGLIELRYPVLDAVRISINQYNELGFGVTAAIGFDFNGEPVSNPLLGAAFAYG